MNEPKENPHAGIIGPRQKKAVAADGESPGPELTSKVLLASIGIEQETITEMSDYIAGFIAKRFPQGLDGPVLEIVAACVLDAFHDGARWCEQQQSVSVGPSLIIKP